MAHLTGKTANSSVEYIRWFYKHDIDLSAERPAIHRYEWISIFTIGEQNKPCWISVLESEKKTLPE